MSAGVTFERNNGPVYIQNQPKQVRASVLGKLIEIMSQAPETEQNLQRESSNIDLKIQFNDLKRNRWIAELYREDAILVDESIKTLDSLILNGSTKLKRQFKRFYNTALGRYGVYSKPFVIDIIKNNSDNIIDDVLSATKDMISTCSELDSEFLQEDIDSAICMIISYSIIECVILENPNDYD
ncbi:MULTISPECIES: hypothetical protein [Proteus]|uniref:hypothetical protein n=1 Tax=Proteus TaxID=583 RepID=UPI000530D3AD|nr:MULTISPECIES: hypothetical protein [Proteus]EIT1739307.1 hypothetical protein [Proteus mirabilis]EJG2210945.1 hypothetical protein [Proteus mirabilis]EKX4939284.1 hypothetical protein [Proteus mirabilis]EKX6258127.1 hypothetical protein [Proteus mirabilis]EKX6489629.1 hypothetical protein [Proteus mirabilis]